MDNVDEVLYHLICCMDDDLFDLYAGLYNAQSLFGNLSASQELDLLKWVMEQE